MPAERYFIDEDLSEHSQKILKGNEFHHLARVMRTKKGESVELVNGRGMLAYATVLEIKKELAALQIERLVIEPIEPARVILAQALPKPERLAFILEKGTELGVDEFWLFPGQLSASKEIFPHQQERIRALTIAAMKQCGRLTLPSIQLKPPLTQWSSIEGQGFFGDLSEEAPLFASFQSQLSSKIPLIFFTGPESGWSDKEMTLLKEKGAKGVKLHPNILRTDTASIAAISLIQHWLMLA